MYSHLDVAQSVSSMLLRPGFDSHNIGHVAQIVDHVLARARRRGFGSEREQLQATVIKCIDHRSMNKLLTRHRHDGVALCEHLANPQRIAGVKVIALDRDGNDTSVLSALSQRIYDIRNRIVHAKQNSTDASMEPLFPFSEESKALQPDIEVLRYIAAAVLIESATSIE